MQNQTEIEIRIAPPPTPPWMRPAATRMLCYVAMPLPDPASQAIAGWFLHWHLHDLCIVQQLFRPLALFQRAQKGLPVLPGLKFAFARYTSAQKTFQNAHCAALSRPRGRGVATQSPRPRGCGPIAWQHAARDFGVCLGHFPRVAATRHSLGRMMVHDFAQHAVECHCGPFL